MNTCRNCAWYCHGDGNCYVPKNIPGGYRLIPFNTRFGSCQDWIFDGLEDWEREQLTQIEVPEMALVVREA